jgi:membrane-bound serine protease (ClpP class)
MKKKLRNARLRTARLCISSFAFILGVTILACGAGVGAPAGSVHVLTTDGTVNPVMERYIDRGIGTAEDEEAEAVVLRLNTPGGLSASMDDIVQRILGAEVPVAVYVWPPGGQAASAGTFITYASHVAVMSPGTVIGSATPIVAGGGDIEGDLGRKVRENAVAKIRSLADLRGRNADWGEAAVREGISATATVALEENVVDLVAQDISELLDEIDGREVVLAGQRRVELATADAPVVYNNRNLIERFLAVIANPNIAFLLLSLGSLAILIEILNPGQIFPGVVGVIALLLAFLALSVIPFNWAGVALIAFAFALFGLELFVASGGILGVGGVVSLVLGGLVLTAGNPPEARVSPWVIFTLSGVLAAFVIFVLANILRIRRMPAQVGVQTMIGQAAVARSPLNPSGMVYIQGEYWAAETDDEEVAPGERVVVVDIEGLKLKVKKEPEGE